MSDNLGVLLDLPGTDIDWVVSGPRGMVLIEHKYPWEGRSWQPLSRHQIVVYKDLAKSPRVLAVLIARYDPSRHMPALWVAPLTPNIELEDQLKFQQTDWHTFHKRVAQAVGLRGRQVDVRLHLPRVRRGTTR